MLGAAIGSGEERVLAREGNRANGSLDRTFGRDRKGLAFVHLGPKDSQEEVEAIAIQSDGKILLAGYAVKGGRLSFDRSEMERPTAPC